MPGPTTNVCPPGNSGLAPQGIKCAKDLVKHFFTFKTAADLCTAPFSVPAGYTAIITGVNLGATKVSLSYSVVGDERCEERYFVPVTNPCAWELSTAKAQQPIKLQGVYRLCADAANADAKVKIEVVQLGSSACCAIEYLCVGGTNAGGGAQTLTGTGIATVTTTATGFNVNVPAPVIPPEVHVTPATIAVNGTPLVGTGPEAQAFNIVLPAPVTVSGTGIATVTTTATGYNVNVPAPVIPPEVHVTPAKINVNGAPLVGTGPEAQEFSLTIPAATVVTGTGIATVTPTAAGYEVNVPAPVIPPEVHVTPAKISVNGTPVVGTGPEAQDFALVIPPVDCAAIKTVHATDGTITRLIGTDAADACVGEDIVDLTCPTTAVVQLPSEGTFIAMACNGSNEPVLTNFKLPASAPAAVETPLVVTMNGAATGVTQSGTNGHTVNLAIPASPNFALTVKDAAGTDITATAVVAGGTQGHGPTLNLPCPPVCKSVFATAVSAAVSSFALGTAVPPAGPGAIAVVGQGTFGASIPEPIPGGINRFPRTFAAGFPVTAGKEYWVLVDHGQASENSNNVRYDLATLGVTLTGGNTATLVDRDNYDNVQSHNTVGSLSARVMQYGVWKFTAASTGNVVPTFNATLVNGAPPDQGQISYMALEMQNLATVLGIDVMWASGDDANGQGLTAAQMLPEAIVSTYPAAATRRLLMTFARHSYNHTITGAGAVDLGEENAQSGNVCNTHIGVGYVDGNTATIDLSTNTTGNEAVNVWTATKTLMVNFANTGGGAATPDTVSTTNYSLAVPCCPAPCFSQTENVPVSLQINPIKLDFTVAAASQYTYELQVNNVVVAGPYLYTGTQADPTIAGQVISLGNVPCGTTVTGDVKVVIAKISGAAGDAVTIPAATINLTGAR